MRGSVRPGPGHRPWLAASGSIRVGRALAATLLAAACGSGASTPPRTDPEAPTVAVQSGAPSPAPPHSPTASTAVAEPPAAPTSAGATSAPAPGPAPGPVLPPDEAALAARFREKDAIAHVRAFVVDESCFRMDGIPMAATRVQSSRINLFDAAEGDVHITAVDTSDASVESLRDLRTFLTAFPEARHRFAIQKLSLALGEQTSSFWRAYCLPQGALFGGPAEIGRVRNEDGSFDEDEYRVGFAPQAVQKLRGLPGQARRLAILHDDDVLLVLPIDKLKALTTPVVTLVTMPASTR